MKAIAGTISLTIHHTAVPEVPGLASIGNFPPRCLPYLYDDVNNERWIVTLITVHVKQRRAESGEGVFHWCLSDTWMTKGRRYTVKEILLHCAQWGRKDHKWKWVPFPSPFISKYLNSNLPMLSKGRINTGVKRMLLYEQVKESKGAVTFVLHLQEPRDGQRPTPNCFRASADTPQPFPGR